MCDISFVWIILPSVCHVPSQVLYTRWQLDQTCPCTSHCDAASSESGDIDPPSRQCSVLGPCPPPHYSSLHPTATHTGDVQTTLAWTVMRHWSLSWWTMFVIENGAPEEEWWVIPLDWHHIHHRLVMEKKASMRLHWDSSSCWTWTVQPMHHPAEN